MTHIKMIQTRSIEETVGFQNHVCIPKSTEHPIKAPARFSRHLSAEFTDLNPAPRGLSLYNEADIIANVVACVLKRIFTV